LLHPHPASASDGRAIAAVRSEINATKDTPPVRISIDPSTEIPVCRVRIFLKPASGFCPRLPRIFDDAVADREANEVGGRLQSQLGQQPRTIGINGLDAQVELCADLPPGFSFGQ